MFEVDKIQIELNSALLLVLSAGCLSSAIFFTRKILSKLYYIYNCAALLIHERYR